jgi:hypothetical protein
MRSTFFWRSEAAFYWLNGEILVLRDCEHTAAVGGNLREPIAQTTDVFRACGGQGRAFADIEPPGISVGSSETTINTCGASGHTPRGA